jgi:hypothetical protein
MGRGRGQEEGVVGFCVFLILTQGLTCFPSSDEVGRGDGTLVPQKRAPGRSSSELCLFSTCCVA